MLRDTGARPVHKTQLSYVAGGKALGFMILPAWGIARVMWQQPLY